MVSSIEVDLDMKYWNLTFKTAAESIEWLSVVFHRK